MLCELKHINEQVFFGGNTLVVVGAVEVVTYPAKAVNVALVPVNDVGKDMSTAELEAYLNKTYAPANLSFKLMKEKSFDYNGNLKLLESGSGLLDAYTDDMQALNNAYVEQVGELKKDALYLFLMNYGGSADKHVAGFMPRQQQVGYIFLADAQENLYHTIAHELGHGAANLAHTFDKTKYGIAQGSTSNLMDYSGGTELVKLQWDALHNPGEVWKILERDEDAEFSISIHKEIIEEAVKELGKKDIDEVILKKLIRGVKDADRLGFANEKWHFDNLYTSNNVVAAWEALYEYFNSVEVVDQKNAYEFGKHLHWLADFYAHSNYVNLYVNYWVKTNGSIEALTLDNVQTFEKVKKDFKPYIDSLYTGHFNLLLWLPGKIDKETKGLFTGVMGWYMLGTLHHVVDNIDYFYADVKGYVHHDALNKDAPGKGQSDEKLQQSRYTLHEFAKAMAIKNTADILKSKSTISGK